MQYPLDSLGQLPLWVSSWFENELGAFWGWASELEIGFLAHRPTACGASSRCVGVLIPQYSEPHPA
eukprot:4791951-Amphidinium_carterae.1